EHGRPRRRGRRLRASARQRTGIARRHRLGPRRYDAQALEGALRRQIDALLRQAATALPEEALHALGGVSLVIEQRTDTAKEVNVLRPVIAPAAAPLERTNLRELAFPEPQHVLRHI